MIDRSTTITTGEQVRRLRPLSARNALRAAAVATGAHGVVMMTAPGGVASALGPPDGAHWVRTCGFLLLALTIVFWSASRWPASMMQRPILWSAGVVATVVAGLAVLELLGGSAGPVSWAVAGVEGTLAVWIGSLLIGDRV